MTAKMTFIFPMIRDNDHQKSDDLKEKLAVFVREAGKKTIILQTIWKRLQSKYRKLCRWLGITDFDEWGPSGTV